MDKKTLAAVVIHLVMTLYEPCLQLKQLSHSREEWVIYQKKELVKAGACVFVCIVTEHRKTEERSEQRKRQLSKIKR